MATLSKSASFGRYACLFPNVFVVITVCLLLTGQINTLEARQSFHVPQWNKKYHSVRVSRDDRSVQSLLSAEEYHWSLPSTSIEGREVNLCTLVPRGGSLEVDVEDEGVVIGKIRNLVRSLLEISDRKSPMISNLVRSGLTFLENILGVDLLPPKKKASKKKRSKKTKSVKSSDESIETKDSVATKKKKKKVDSDGSADKSTKSKETVATRKKKKAESSASEKIKAKPRATSTSTSPSPKTPKSSAAAKKHLARDLKATNPNYRIQRELKAFLTSPPPNLSVAVGKNIRVWIVTLKGPPNTVYEGETYRLKVTFPVGYPTTPPSVYFLQPTPRHEHVYTNGDICLSLLGKDWRPTMTAQSIAMSILSILSGAQQKGLPMDNARHAVNKPGQPQDDWVYHDDNC